VPSGESSACFTQHQVIDGQQRLWDRIVAEHGLKPHGYRDIVAWGYPDNVFNSDYDIVSSTTKARLAGFYDTVDTEAMFLRMFGEFRNMRVIP